MSEHLKSWRRTELAAFGTEVVPLDDCDAISAYEQAMKLCSRRGYGLNETVFPTIERLDVEKPKEAQTWLTERVCGGDLLLVFGRDDVFRIPASLFLDRWQDIFCPSRDDVMIVPVTGGWAAFYSHEDEFEFARVPATKASDPYQPPEPHNA